jgi:hypothetical protein
MATHGVTVPVHECDVARGDGRGHDPAKLAEALAGLVA